MAWITLALRKRSLKAEVNQLNYDDIDLSRKVRNVHRHLSRQQSIFNSQKTKELKEAKSAYIDAKSSRPKKDDGTFDLDSAEYQQWQVKYAEAQEDYAAKKEEIQDYYDELNEEIETEAQDEEDFLQGQIDETEAQRDARSAELQSITDQVKTEIESSAIKF